MVFDVLIEKIPNKQLIVSNITKGVDSILLKTVKMGLYSWASALTTNSKEAGTPSFT